MLFVGGFIHNFIVFGREVLNGERLLLGDNVKTYLDLSSKVSGVVSKFSSQKVEI